MGPTPVLVKALTQVNTTNAAVSPGGTAIQSDPAVAGLGSGYVVMWTDESRFHNANGDAVVAQRYDSLGNTVGGEFEISQFGSGDQSDAAIVQMPFGGFAGAGGLVIAVEHRDAGDSNIYVTRWNADMSFIQTDLIDFSAAQTVDPSLTAFGNGSYAVAYTVGSDDDTDIVGRIVSATGVVGAQFDIHNETDNSHLSELATLSDGNFVAVFQDEFNGSATDIDIRYRIFTPTGTPVIGSTSVPGGFGAAAEVDPDVAALIGGGFVVVWTDDVGPDSDIRATILTNTGDTVHSNILVNATQAGAQNEARVVGLLDGGFLVTWEDDEAVLVRGQRFDASGNPVGDEFTMNTGNALLGGPDLARLISGEVAFVTTFTGLETDVGTSLWNPRGTVAALGDVLWQQADGTLATSEREIGRPGSFLPQGVGDFDGDGDGDILLRAPNGTVRVWELENGQFSSSQDLAVVSNGWTIQGLGDFDADGDDDILWRHQDGAVVTWEMEDGAYVQNHNIALATPGWAIQGLGDFDGDGDEDILWRHRDGDVVTWEMENGAYVVNHHLPVVSTAFQIAGTGDFDDDGDTDILWRGNAGEVVNWEMQDGAFVVNHNLPAVATTFQVAGVEDFDSDGDSDIVWRHDEGLVVSWDMENGTLALTHNFGVTGNDWQIRGTGELDLV